jgi:hypothetical protein
MTACIKKKKDSNKWLNATSQTPSKTRANNPPQNGEKLKIRANFCEIGTTKQKSYKAWIKQKIWDFKKWTRLMFLPLANLTEMRRAKTQVSKIQYERM